MNGRETYIFEIIRFCTVGKTVVPLINITALFIAELDMNWT